MLRQTTLRATQPVTRPSRQRKRTWIQISRGLSYLRRHLQPGRFSARGRKGPLIRLPGPHRLAPLLPRHRITTHIQITITLRRPSPPCRAGSFPMHFYHHRPASSQNGGLVGQDQTRTCYRVPLHSRRRPRKRGLVSLVKTNKTRSAKHQTVDRLPRGRPRRPKCKPVYFLGLTNGIQWSSQGYCVRRFAVQLPSFLFVGYHIFDSLYPFLFSTYRSFNRFASPSAFLVSILVTAMVFHLFILLFPLFTGLQSFVHYRPARSGQVNHMIMYIGGYYLLTESILL